MIIDLSLNNKELYDGCEIKEVAGRLSLITPPDIAINIVGKNIAKIVTNTPNRAYLVLTGPMAVWAYLVVFHAVVHAFKEVWYDDGKGNKLQLAQH